MILPRPSILTAAPLLVCAALPFLLTEYEATLAGFVGIAAIAAIGLVLLTGISGQTSFGHATFVGLAAYTTAWMSRYGGWPPLAGLVAGLIITGGTAFLLGLITSRISGHYLPLATIAWGASFFYLFGVLPGLGGFNGFGDIPPLFPGITRGTAAALIGVVLIAATLGCTNLLNSRTGRAMRALAQSRIMAESVGVDTARLARVDVCVGGVAGRDRGVAVRSCPALRQSGAVRVERKHRIRVHGGDRGSIAARWRHRRGGDRGAAPRPVDRVSAAAFGVIGQFRDCGVQYRRHPAVAFRAAGDCAGAVSRQPAAHTGSWPSAAEFGRCGRGVRWRSKPYLWRNDLAG